MKSSRPRSLDMSSTWSMDSRGSSASGGCLTSSSGASSGGAHATSSSSESGSERPSPCVSRNASFQSNHSCASSGVVTHHGGGGGLTVSSSVAAGQSMTSSTVSQSSSTDHHATSSAHIPPMHRLQPVPPLPKPPAKTDIPKMETPKTVTTLMGGRGYINWRRPGPDQQFRRFPCHMGDENMTKIEQFSNTEQPTIVLPNKSILSQSLSHGRMQIVWFLSALYPQRRSKPTLT